MIHKNMHIVDLHSSDYYNSLALHIAVRDATMYDSKLSFDQDKVIHMTHEDNYVSCGDRVEKIDDRFNCGGKLYTYMGIYMNKYVLLSHSGYIHEVLGEESNAITIDEFAEKYELFSVYNTEKDKCISEKDYEIVLEMIQKNRELVPDGSIAFDLDYEGDEE